MTNDASSREVRPGPRDRTALDTDGALIDVPPGWELLPPGDAGLTRRVKAAGPSWTVKQPWKRRMISKGVWAPAEHITAARAAVEGERATPEYARRRAAEAQRRERSHAVYVAEFERALRQFLAFHDRHADLERTLARAVTQHATPVGSGTVARTQRIPINERVSAAVIAWMRHQTTAYDHMSIARVKGERRSVRRELAQRSRALLDRYRRDEEPAKDCPLRVALGEVPPPAPEPFKRPTGARGGWANKA